MRLCLFFRLFLPNTTLDNPKHLLASALCVYATYRFVGNFVGQISWDLLKDQTPIEGQGFGRADARRQIRA